MAVPVRHFFSCALASGYCAPSAVQRSRTPHADAPLPPPPHNRCYHGLTMVIQPSGDWGVIQHRSRSRSSRQVCASSVRSRCAAAPPPSPPKVFAELKPGHVIQKLGVCCLIQRTAALQIGDKGYCRHSHTVTVTVTVTQSLAVTCLSVRLTVVTVIRHSHQTRVSRHNRYAPPPPTHEKEKKRTGSASDGGHPGKVNDLMHILGDRDDHQ
jgi:hypothetical protein